MLSTISSTANPRKNPLSSPALSTFAILGSQVGLCAFPFGVAGEEPSDIEGAPSPIASPLRSRRDRAPSPASYGFLPPLPSRFPAFCLVKVALNTTGIPRPPKSVHRNLPKHLVTLGNTVRTDLVNRTIEADAERKRDGKNCWKGSGTRIRGWRGAPRRKYRKRI